MANLIAAPLLGVLMLACCGVSNMVATCGENDFSCFAGYAQDGCKPVTMRVTSDIPVDAEMTGKESSGNCRIELTGRPESEFRSKLIAEGLDPATVDEYLSQVDYKGEVEGRKASCSVDPNSTHEFFSQGAGFESCSGPLISGIYAIAR